MDSPKTTARRAGVLYLLLALLGPINAFYIPGRFIVSGDAAATARNIVADPLTYRLGILSELVVDVIFLVLVLLLYQLLQNAGRQQARLMVILVSVGVALGLVNLLNQAMPLVLLSGADFLAAFTRPQLDALSLAFLKLRTIGAYLDFVFWGLWLFPFGVLVMRSGLFPRLLGVLLIVGCIAYVAQSLTGLAVPAYQPAVALVLLPFYAIGELAMIVWLLVKGAREQPLVARPTG